MGRFGSTVGRLDNSGAGICHHLWWSNQSSIRQVVIAGAVRLDPPYTAETAITDNEIVLSRVTAVLAGMPTN